MPSSISKCGSEGKRRATHVTCLALEHVRGGDVLHRAALEAVADGVECRGGVGHAGVGTRAVLAVVDVVLVGAVEVLVLVDGDTGAGGPDAVVPDGVPGLLDDLDGEVVLLLNGEVGHDQAGAGESRNGEGGRPHDAIVRVDNERKDERKDEAQ